MATTSRLCIVKMHGLHGLRWAEQGGGEQGQGERRGSKAEGAGPWPRHPGFTWQGEGSRGALSGNEQGEPQGSAVGAADIWGGSENLLQNMGRHL